MVREQSDEGADKNESQCAVSFVEKFSLEKMSAELSNMLGDLVRCLSHIKSNAVNSMLIS